MFIHELFFKTAHHLPQAEAFSFGDISLTYEQSAQRVENLARGLRNYLPAGARVAINTAKSHDTILMMLACLYAGLAYVPIDTSSPLNRRRFILQDCQASALVVDSQTIYDWELQDSFPSSLHLIVGPSLSQWPFRQSLTAQELMEEGANASPSASISAPIDKDDLAYILYTSGSTGAPKGVMITHGNAAAFVTWAVTFFDIHPGDRVAGHAPLHFDLPIFDIYVSLAQGATVCPIDEKSIRFPQAVLRFLHNQRITVLYAVPSALTTLINHSTLAQDSLPSLRLLLYAGEEFHPTPLSQLMNKLPHVRVFNLYGPIETNVVTAFEVRPEHLHYPRIPIGYPIFNTQIFLLDEAGKIIEESDEEGEIVVNGPSVTPGYLNRPDLTTKAQPQLSDRHIYGRCYRTGDFARWGEQGLLHFLGRRDALIKTRGFRVDLGDVEATLTTYPGIAEVGVIAQPHPDYTNLLYAFVVPSPGKQIEESALLAWSRDNLPSYMVPYQITICTRLPKTSTGKIARKELLSIQS